MEQTQEADLTLVDDPDAQFVDMATRFLMALFAPGDRILFRPIECWKVDDKKTSWVIYKEVMYRCRDQELLARTIRRYLETSRENRGNIFFGVCPRLGPDGKYDLAWQIRTVRVLWADLDNATVDEALERCRSVGLPPPSIVVNSGNGVHLYWLLESPYEIDDVGPPAPVLTDWQKSPDGRKRPFRYILEDEEKIPVSRLKTVRRISPKGERLQQIVAGVSKAIGGDHTHDLARLLRVPGRLNRKNERNGCTPRPTELEECEPARRYPISLFEKFAIPTPEAEKQKLIDSLHLPKVRRLTPAKADRLNARVSECAVAQSGSRSEADFGMCCFAIRGGVGMEEVWQLVQSVGKFAERGRPYFDLTWKNAEDAVREDMFDKAQQSLPPTPNQDPEKFVDFGDGDVAPRPTIHVDLCATPVAATMGGITDHLVKAGCCYNRANQLVVVHDNAIRAILGAPELTGMLNQYVEFYFEKGKSREFKPLPTNYSNTWLNRRDELQKLQPITLFTRNPVYSQDWKLASPGYNEASGIYYAGPVITPRGGRAHVDRLLADFCFRSKADRANYLGMLLTTILVARFIGSKPAAIFNGNQPGVGKSILAQILGIIRDGGLVETISFNPNDEEFEKRLGASVARGTTTIIIDNAKARGRNQSISSQTLERSITDPILSFRLLGTSQIIRAENSHIFCITANTPDISTDLVSRSVPINLYYEGSPTRRVFSIANPEEFVIQNRVEVLGELVGMVERWLRAGSPRVNVPTRFNKCDWGNIIGGILDVADVAGFLTNADVAALDFDETQREFAELVQVLAGHEQGVWTGMQLAELAGTHNLLAGDLGDGSARSRATRMGLVAGRFVNEQFVVNADRKVRFHREDTRKGTQYSVAAMAEVPNV